MVAGTSNSVYRATGFIARGVTACLSGAVILSFGSDYSVSD